MGFDENISMYNIAHALIDEGEVFQGYLLVLLQQIRDNLKDLEGAIDGLNTAEVKE